MQTPNAASRPSLYGLLYVKDTEAKRANLPRRADPIDTYVGCASICAASIEHHGLAFKVITNDPERLESRVAALGLPPLPTVRHDFRLVVPESLQFWSAHFKLELYEAFGAGTYGSEVGLVDIDAVMIAPFKVPALGPRQLLGYDITAQVVPYHGYERVCADLGRVTGRRVGSPRWLGGELIVGSAAAFQQLSAAVQKYWPRYLKYASTLHHVGDEMLVSAVVAAEPKIEVVDGGELRLVQRWWTARTGFPQRPFIEARRTSLLHLPADKTFLASAAHRPFEPLAFCSAFERVAWRKLAIRRILNAVQRPSAGRRRMHVARIR